MENIFKVGEKVVYPAQGVAKISGIEGKNIGGIQEIFYVLKVIETDKRILVPVKKAKVCGMRPLMGEDEVADIFAILAQKKVNIEHEPWNRRYRRYLELIKTGSAEDLSVVIRDLNILKKNKPLSFGERKIMETAINLLITEISYVIDKTAEALIHQIKEILDTAAA